jgi:hypothetical protein
MAPPSSEGTAPEDLARKRRFASLFAQSVRKGRKAFFKPQPGADVGSGLSATGGAGGTGMLKQKLGE